VREMSIHLLRLFWIQVWSQLDSLDQEIELLRNAPPSPENGPQTTAEDVDAWRLDAPPPKSMFDGRGPVLDQSGKVDACPSASHDRPLRLFQPLRPFTILPGGATDRARLQGEVFRPDHRLPSMSVDQYLEIERQRGNIITGGG
jgi:immunoglobulin-binding protein 1